MTDDNTDIDGEWHSEANTYRVRGRRSADGMLDGVSCRVEYFEVREDSESDRFGVRNGVTVALDYHVIEGVAELSTISNDRGNDGEISPRVFAAVPAGEDAVANVPGVEHVERVEETLGAVIEDGR